VLSLGDLGDTTHNPNRETATASKDSYQHVKHLTEGLTLPLLTVAGNHDDPKLMEAAFPNQWESQKNGVCRYSFHGVDLISVDVRTGPEATGFISPETAKELDETLAQCRGALIFSHFPLFDLDNERIASGLSVTNREVLAPIFDRHKDKTQTGLWDALQKFQNLDDIGTFEFNHEDVVRNPLISKILNKTDVSYFCDPIQKPSSVSMLNYMHICPREYYYT
jgi:hypothetical protein